MNELLSARKSAWDLVMFTSSVSYPIFENKIDTFEKKNNINENFIIRLRDYNKSLTRKLPNSISEDAVQNEILLEEYNDFISSINNSVLKRIFELIILHLDVDPSNIGGDNVSVYAESFKLYCSYKEYNKKNNNSSLVAKPAESIFTGSWRTRGTEENNKIFPISLDCKNGKIIDFQHLGWITGITEARNVYNHSHKFEKDLLTGQIRKGNLIYLSSIYVATVYVFDEILDLMIKYI